jgi:hypothetical protein
MLRNRKVIINLGFAVFLMAAIMGVESRVLANYPVYAEVYASAYGCEGTWQGVFYPPGPGEDGVDVVWWWLYDCDDPFENSCWTQYWPMHSDGVYACQNDCRNNKFLTNDDYEHGLCESICDCW